MQKKLNTFLFFISCFVSFNSFANIRENQIGINSAGSDTEIKQTEKEQDAQLRLEIIEGQKQQVLYQTSQMSVLLSHFFKLPENEKKDFTNKLLNETSVISCKNETKNSHIRICDLSNNDVNLVGFAQPNSVTQIYFKNKKDFDSWKGKDKLIANCGSLKENFEQFSNKMADNILALKAKDEEDQKNGINISQKLLASQFEALYSKAVVVNPFFVFNYVGEKQFQTYSCLESSWQDVITIPDTEKYMNDCEHPEWIKKLGLEEICK